jgi:hypothetical protein
LLSEKALLAAMTCVDLNPIRADIATSVSTSRFTSVKVRAKTLRKQPELANQVKLPLIGTKSHHVQITEADYIELVDFTGREMHPGKRGKIAASEPRALTKLGFGICRKLSAQCLAVIAPYDQSPQLLRAPILKRTLQLAPRLKEIYEPQTPPLSVLRHRRVCLQHLLTSR